MNGKRNQQYQPTATELEAFDYHWQHLRRNERYQSFHAGYVRVKERLYKTARRKLRWPPTLRALLCKALDYGRVPLIDPGIKDSREALRVAVRTKPDYLQSPYWQAIIAKQSAPAALGCLDETVEPPTHENELTSLTHNLDEAERILNNPELIANEAMESGVPLEKQRMICLAKFMSAEAKLRAALESDPRLPFTLNTSLPWGTVLQALQKQWSKIKALRRRVGLDPDIHPTRASKQWLEQVELYDLCRPHWEANRRKVANLKRIWQENLGFVEALRVLGTKLSKADLDLAQRLDSVGRIPKGFYRFLETKQRQAHLAQAWDEGIDHLCRKRERISRRSAASFDDAQEVELTAMVSKRAVRELPPEHWGHTGETLEAWRSHFSVPRLSLPPRFKWLSRKKRSRWFNAARKRIEAVWTGPDQPEPITFPPRLADLSAS